MKSLTLLVLSLAATSCLGHYWHQSEEDAYLEAVAKALLNIRQGQGEPAEGPNIVQQLEGKICYTGEGAKKYGEAAAKCSQENAAQGRWDWQDEDEEDEYYQLKEMEEEVKFKKCLYTEMGWVDADKQLQKDAIQADIKTLPIAEELRSADKTCSTESDAVSGQQPAAGRWSNWWSEPQIDEEAVAAAVQTATYLDCIIGQIAAACSGNLEHIVGMFDREAYLSGWSLSQKALPNLQASGLLPEGKNVPDPLFVSFPSPVGDLNVKPGQRVFTENMLEPPSSKWHCDPEALYTYVIEDNSLARGPRPFRYWHWLKMNIQGCDINTGEEVMCYIPSFSFTGVNGLDELGNLRETPDIIHEHMHMVFRQPGSEPITPNDFDKQCTCDATIGSGRVGTVNEGDGPPPIRSHARLAKDYNLELVAASYINNPVGPATKRIMCEYNFCTKKFPPFDVNGINKEPKLCTERVILSNLKAPEETAPTAG